jgi:Tfp pilus assembly protein PilZ
MSVPSSEGHDKMPGLRSAFDEIQAISHQAPVPADTSDDDLGPLPEHRRSPRVSYRDPVQARPIGPGSQSTWALLGHDLSETGLMLSSPELFPVKGRLLLSIDVAEVSAPIQVVGRVVWVAREGLQDRYRIGVQFEEPSALARAQLRELVLKRDRPALVLVD